MLIKVQCRLENSNEKYKDCKFPQRIGHPITEKSFIRCINDRSLIFPIKTIIHDEYTDTGQIPMLCLILGNPKRDNVFKIEEKKVDDKKL